MPLHVPTPGVTAHTELTDKEVAAIIDHADLSVSDAKLLSGVGLSDGQICKLPVAVVGNILLRGPAAWAAGEIPIPVEGDYTSWAVYDSFGDPDHSSNKWADAAAVNKDDLKIIISGNVGASGETLKVYDIATKTLGAVILSDIMTRGYADQPIMGSTFGSYSAVIWASAVPGTCNRLSILKHGVVVQTFTDTQLGLFAGTISGVFVSESGKYIIVSGYLPVPIDDWGWVVLEGS